MKLNSTFLFFVFGLFLHSAIAQDSTTATNPFSVAGGNDSLLKPTTVFDTAYSHTKDSVLFKKKTEKRHSAKKAAWMSAVLPGLGQAYNKRWWKIPIVYAGFAGLGYGLYYYGTNYNGYRNAYRIQVDGDSTTLASYKGISRPAELKSYRDFHKRNLDIMAVITALWYAVNIIDAAVDAHLFHWNVDDKLALDIQPMAPTFFNANAAYGLTFQFTLKQPSTKKHFQL